MPTILDHQDAQELLEQTQVEPPSLHPCRARLQSFIERYLPCFYRREPRGHPQTIHEGKLTGLLGSN